MVIALVTSVDAVEVGRGGASVHTRHTGCMGPSWSDARSQIARALVARDGEMTYSIDGRLDEVDLMTMSRRTRSSPPMLARPLYRQRSFEFLHACEQSGDLSLAGVTGFGLL